MYFTEIMSSWLQVSLGRRLASASILIHVNQDRKDTFPQQIGIVFEDCEPLRIYGSSDGASLSVSLGSIVGSELGEYGALVVFSAVDEPCFQKVLSKKLVSVSAVKSLIECKVIGLALSFDNAKSIFFLNLGDELFIYNEIPDGIFSSEKLGYVVLGELVK